MTEIVGRGVGPGPEYECECGARYYSEAAMAGCSGLTAGDGGSGGECTIGAENE